MLATLVLLLAGLLIALYKWWTSVFGHWRRRGVQEVAGAFPLGSDAKLSLMTVYQGYTIEKMYHKFSTQPYFGIYMIRSPFLVVRCPEIISMILTKEFSHFRNRQFLKIHESDTISHHLFNLQEEKWKILRTKLNPTFSPARLKGMFPLFIKCAENLQAYTKEKVGTTINIKDTIVRFTTDTICNCVIGLEANTMTTADSEVEKIGYKSTDLNLIILLKVALNLTFPDIAHRFPIKIFTEDVEKFFIKLVEEISQFREKNDVKINDFMEILIQLKNKGTIGKEMKIENGGFNCQSNEMTLSVMAAQCFFLFVAGFENSSSIQTYCLYELAWNPHTQRKLQDEIKTVLEKHHGEITYEAVKEMVYLDMVISETMRKYPILPFLTRICTMPITLPDGFHVEKGDQMLIPLWSLHHDPKYFPQPEKFDPERFSDDNKELIVPYTYLPFGDGPRTCFGRKFGMLQTKLGLISILKGCSVETTEETVAPMILKGRAFSTLPKFPVNLKLVCKS